jgi:hypothetical protein
MATAKRTACLALMVAVTALAASHGNTQDELEIVKPVFEHALPNIEGKRMVPRPDPGPGEVLVRVEPAGVGPWDGWIRAGKSALPQPLPLTLGSDLSGHIVSMGPETSGLRAGDPVYGVTNPQFVGAYAELEGLRPQLKGKIVLTVGAS